MEQPRATVLVVDDDPEVLAIAVATVSALGYAAIPAHSGQEALSILQRELAVDLLFTDITMPAGMNGWELGRQSRRLSTGPQGDLHNRLYPHHAGGGRTGLRATPTEAVAAQPVGDTAPRGA